MPNYVLKKAGETVQGFVINGIVGYHSGEPTYTTTCCGCGTSGVAVKHDEFRRGTARCSSDVHFAVVRSLLPAPAPQPEPEPEPITVNQYVANLRANRDAENKKYIGTARDQWNEYISHGIIHGWDLQTMIDIADWLKVPLEYREQILEKQRAGDYDKKDKQ